MVRIRILLVFVLFFISNHLFFAQNTILKGNAKTYSGTKIQLCKYSDFITNSVIVLDSLVVDNNGDFQFNITLNETEQLFIPLFVFKGFIYAEPDKTYELILPGKTVKSEEDELNPFFKEQDFLFSLINPKEDDLNPLIVRFEKLYNHELNVVFKKSFMKYSKSIIDSVINTIENQIPKTNNKYFTDFKEYRYAMLRYIAYMRNKDIVIESFFTNKPVLVNNIAYTEMFEETFMNFFGFSETIIPKAEIIQNIQNKSFSGLKKTLANTKLFNNPKLSELLIIKGLIDGYYSQMLPAENVFVIIDSIIAFSDSDWNKTIAQNFKKQATKLMQGYPAPEISLPDKDYKITTLKNFSGKFIYLTFFNPKSYSCVQELEVLKNIRKQNYEMLEIVSVFVDNDLAAMQNFLKQNPNFNWVFLYFNKNTELLKNYNVRAFPTYYLISPDGILYLLPAPAPTDNFEVKYFTSLKAWKTDQIRKQGQKKTLGN